MAHIRLALMTRYPFMGSTAYLLSACVALIAMGFPLSTRAFDQIHFESPAGTVSLRQGSAFECEMHYGIDECRILALNGRFLLIDSYVWISSVQPSKKDPKVVFAGAHGGGAAVPVVYYVIDLTHHEPLKLEVDLAWNTGFSNFQADPSGLTFQVIGRDVGPLGEPIQITYRYEYGSGSLNILRTEPQLSNTPMESKKFSKEVLDDPAQRQVLLDLMGPHDFKELRTRFIVYVPLVRVTESIVFGRGIIPGSLGWWAGAFAIDTANKRAWAAYTISESGKFFGTLGPEDTKIKDLFEQWMNQYRYSWSDFEGAPATTGKEESTIDSGANKKASLSQQASVPAVEIQNQQLTGADRFVQGFIGGFLLILFGVAIAIFRWAWKRVSEARRKSIEIGTKIVNEVRTRIEGVPDAGNRFDDLYMTALTELDTESTNYASWAKALANSEGDKSRARAFYIKYRVEQLKREGNSEPPNR